MANSTYRIEDLNLQQDKFRKVSRPKDEWHGPCPSCYGHDRFSVQFQINRFFCRVCGYTGWLEELSLDHAPGFTTEEMKQRKKDRLSQDQKDYKQMLLDRISLQASGIVENMQLALLADEDLLEELMHPGGHLEGLTIKTIRRWKIGLMLRHKVCDDDGDWQDTRALAFPVYNREALITIRLRPIDQPVHLWKWGKYRPIKAGLGIGLFIADYYKRNDPLTHWCVLVEGEKKAMMLHQEGIPALGMWGVWTIKNSWIPVLQKRYNKIFLVHEEAHEKNEHVVGAIQHLRERLGPILRVIELDGKPDTMLAHGEMSVVDFVRKISVALTGG